VAGEILEGCGGFLADFSLRVATATRSNFTPASSREYLSSPTRASCPAMPKRCKSA
jgi:hypothetical protein